MEIKKPWHRLPLKKKELLSKWLAKIRWTNTPVNEHSRLCGDHFEADCFKKIPGSSRVNLKPQSFALFKRKQRGNFQQSENQSTENSHVKHTQPVRWYCRMWDWQHGAWDRGVWRTVEKNNQRIGAIPGERNCSKERPIALMRDDVEISLVTSKRGLVVMVSREY